MLHIFLLYYLPIRNHKFAHKYELMKSLQQQWYFEHNRYLGTQVHMFYYLFDHHNKVKDIYQHKDLYLDCRKYQQIWPGKHINIEVEYLNLTQYQK